VAIACATMVGGEDKHRVFPQTSIIDSVNDFSDEAVDFVQFGVVSGRVVTGGVPRAVHPVEMHEGKTYPPPASARPPIYEVISATTAPSEDKPGRCRVKSGTEGG